MLQRRGEAVPTLAAQQGAGLYQLGECPFTLTYLKPL